MVQGSHEMYDCCVCVLFVFLSLMEVACMHDVKATLSYGALMPHFSC